MFGSPKKTHSRTNKRRPLTLLWGVCPRLLTLLAAAAATGGLCHQAGAPPRPRLFEAHAWPHQRAVLHCGGTGDGYVVRWLRVGGDMRQQRAAQLTHPTLYPPLSLSLPLPRQPPWPPLCTAGCWNLMILAHPVARDSSLRQGLMACASSTPTSVATRVCGACHAVMSRLVISQRLPLPSLSMATVTRWAWRAN